VCSEIPNFEALNEQAIDMAIMPLEEYHACTGDDIMMI
jgi:hypothetical protein